MFMYEFIKKRVDFNNFLCILILLGDNVGVYIRYLGIGFLGWLEFFEKVCLEDFVEVLFILLKGESEVEIIWDELFLLGEVVGVFIGKFVKVVGYLL